MKKKSIVKLKLNSISFSNLNIHAAKGGYGDSFNICQSVNNFCETVNVTKCYGNQDCIFFPTGTEAC